MADGTARFNNTTFNKMLALSSELNCQLERWYYSIPDKLRPSIGIEPIPNRRGRVLRTRYFAARHIIHRPFVLVLQQMLSLSHSLPTAISVLLDKCEAATTSCTAYLHNMQSMLDQRSSYLWNFSQDSMACLLVLTMAISCPQLRPSTPDIEPLRSMVV